MTPKPGPGDRVTVRYTFILPETEPEGGFKLPPTPLEQVGIVEVQEAAAATKDDPVGTVRRLRSTGQLVVKRDTEMRPEVFNWLALSVGPAPRWRTQYSDSEVCGNSDYVGAVPGSEAAQVAVPAEARVWKDREGDYWFELMPERLTLGSAGSFPKQPIAASFSRACERKTADTYPWNSKGVVDVPVAKVWNSVGGDWMAETVTLS